MNALFWQNADILALPINVRFRRQSRYPKDGVIGRPACRSLEIVGAALQADGETRSAFAASSIRRRSVSHGPFCRTRRISQVLLTLSVMDRDILTGKCRSVTLRRRA